MKKHILLIAVFGIIFSTNAQDQTINGNLSVTGNIESTKILLNDPNTITDWNSIWQSGFFESESASNSPESSGWFWGVNFNHRSNNSNYKYNGQIAIKNSSTNPTMYFRSTDINGSGIWSKIIHNKGNQTINGNFEVVGDINLGADISTQTTRHNTYGNKLFFLGANNNTDGLWMARYNLTSNPNSSEIHVNIGDDPTHNDDKFVVGVTQGSTWNPRFTVLGDGRVGIGTTSTGTHKLAVEGTIGA